VKISVLLSVSVAVSVLLSSPVLIRSAHAFGGFWSSQAAPVKQTAEDVILVDNPDSTVTAIVRMSYTGASERFAWVIPVKGTPKIGVSSDTVFQRLEVATAPEYLVEVAVKGACKGQGGAPSYGAAAYGAASATSPHDAGAGSVAEIDRGSIDAYDYALIKVDPKLDDPTKAATDWLSANGYEWTSRDAAVLTPYLRDGFGLLAFQLRTGKQSGAVEPIVLTYESELPTIPLRLTSLAAEDETDIRLWVIGPTQAVPRNYESLVLDDARIDWSTAGTYAAGTPPSGGAGRTGPVRKPINYDAVVADAVREAGGHGFVTELAGPASQYRSHVWSPVDEERISMLPKQRYEDGIDAVVAASERFGGFDRWNDAVAGAVIDSHGVSLDEFAREPSRYRGLVKVDATKFFRLLREKVVAPVEEAGKMFYRAPYLTRLHARMRPIDMTADPVFHYNGDLAQIQSTHIAKQVIRCSRALSPGEAPFRLMLPHGGAIAGRGGETWPVALRSMPANLKRVLLSTSGPGTVVQDNSDAIGTRLFELAGAASSDPEMPMPPQNGVSIGGSGVVRPRAVAPQPIGAKPSAAHACNVSPSAGSRSGDVRAWLPLAALLFARGRRRRDRRVGKAIHALTLMLVSACHRDKVTPAKTNAPAVPPGAMTREQLKSPEACKGCHPNHYREWSSSMHAYASRDPVFVAMNKRGQRETAGELGKFCLRCHAPMAVLDEVTTDGSNLERLPDTERGVTCYFCHNVTGVESNHNGMLHVAGDTTMRGPIRDPRAPAAHRAAFSEIFDEGSPKSAAMCGGCHDIVTPAGVHLERTFEEYRAGIFSKSATGAPPLFSTCAGCHMPAQRRFAANTPGLALRNVHEHLWPGVDLALTDFPHRDAMRSAVEDCELRASVTFFTLEVTPPDLFTFQIETNAGHNQPSGAAQDRRMWLEVLAYDANGALLPGVSSGNIRDDEPEERPESDPKHDPHLLMFRDRIYDGKGRPVHMFWQAEKSPAHPEGYESNLLPPPTTTYVEGKHAVLQQYRLRGKGGLPARVTARLRIRPIALDVLSDLVATGDLDPAIAAQMPTLGFGAQIEWTKDAGFMKTIAATIARADCNKQRCLLDPGSKDCHEAPPTPSTSADSRY
jgi:hypothetical protein